MDIDEAIRHIQNMLAEPSMAKSRRNILLDCLDDLLEARYEITQTQQLGIELMVEAINGDKRSSVDNAKTISQ